MIETFFENAKAVLEHPTELLLATASGVALYLLNSVRRWFKKGGIKSVIKLTVGYFLNLFAKNSDELTEDEAREKQLLINSVLNIPELQPYFDKANKQFEKLIDDYQGRLNDINAKLKIVDGEDRTAYLKEKAKIEEKLKALYEENTSTS
jgi:hypothetical protein